jgi:hypothetical protein
MIMKAVQRITRLVLVLLFFGPTIVAAGNPQVFIFNQNSGITVDILSEREFVARFGDNPDIPLTDHEVLALAQKLYPPLGLERLNGTEEISDENAHRFWCGEYEVGLLFAALQSPRISNETRLAVDHIIAQSKPPLPKLFKSKHFNFRYTDSNPDPRHNVTAAEIGKTAQFLDSYWDTYSSAFTTPKHYTSGSREVIDINVYYMPPDTQGNDQLGRTSFFWNFIELNSKLVVKSNCLRRTVSAHELFHRVQYSYGYVNGMAMMKWMVEGTAVWSQKYTNSSIADYIHNMNSGLEKPNVGLINKRSYDAAHFWVKLAETAPAGWQIIKDVWGRYKTNGHNSKGAVNSAIMNAFGYGFDHFVTLWNNANYMKDLDNSGQLYDYWEDEKVVTSCGETFGPLASVPMANTAFLIKDMYHPVDGSVEPYGAKYFKFELEDDISCLTIGFDALEGNFSYSLIGLQNGKWMKILSSTNAHYSYAGAPLQGTGRWTAVVVVVGGTGQGGRFKIWADTRCIKGDWTGTTSTYCFAEYFRLSQLGPSLSGLMVCYDMSWIAPWCRVKGTIDGLKITLTRFDCNKWRTCEEDCSGNYVGTINSKRNCISGTYKHENGKVEKWVMVKGAVDPSLIPNACPP